MKYIIDTHIFLWLVFNPEKISKEKLQQLEDPENTIYIASISFWEISIKFNLGKLDLQGITPEELPDVAAEMGILVLNIDEKTMASFYQLEKQAKHKDPFDRIIIWFCITHQYILMSQDDKFQSYIPLGLLTV
ncbi:MAG: type II toxin-antitoxin system VapC family toxin [Methyloprofundus sp.]|nr:type II toxin-antitoxin system VapC family toxin [Methyloprofundus sp.]